MMNPLHSSAIRTPFLRARVLQGRPIIRKPQPCPPQRRSLGSSNPRNNNTPPPTRDPGSEARSRTRFRALNDRLPRFLQRYTTPLLNAPITQLTSFLILHEITAVVPLFGLFGLFHYTGWTPRFLVGDHHDNTNSAGTAGSSSGGENSSGTSAFDEGVRKFGKWLRKRGWVDEEDQIEAERESSSQSLSSSSSTRGSLMIIHFAAAYAITKALLPVRIALSVWATPWFAGAVLVPIRRGVGRIFQKRHK